MSEDETTAQPMFIPSLHSSRLRRSPLLDYIRFSEFKRLLGQLAATVEQGGVKSLAIISLFPGEGRTFLVGAVALAYAVLLHKRVLIVNTTLKLGGGSLDIRDIYESQLKYAPIHGPRESKTDRMIDLMSPQMGDSQDSEADTVDFLIGKYIDGFQHNYDLVLIDTCPMSASGRQLIDPVVIASQADSSILVTSEISLKREALVAAKVLLAGSRVKLLGTIHNSGLPPKPEQKAKKESK